ncbi:LysE family transporter [Streptomyces sp. NPDC006463]|uniref:LysE family transporter n=1 Tax=Streptomyces sp. NPDC006463 TaxID=3364746 RepID=UPI00368196F3
MRRGRCARPALRPASPPAPRSGLQDHASSPHIRPDWHQHPHLCPLPAAEATQPPVHHPTGPLPCRSRRGDRPRPGRSVAPAVTGLVAGHAAYALVAVAGLAVIVASSPAALTALTAAGATYLLWLGRGVLRQPAVPATAGEDADAFPRAGHVQRFRDQRPEP